MLPQEIIRRKRHNQTLSAEEIAAFIAGLTSGAVTEGQAAAFAMAVYFNGMSRSESGAVTLAMRDSGAVLDWSKLTGPVTDKHSTGGVGDNVSLMLAPMVAACGADVAMISGRGLGLRVAACSVITNLAAGMTGTELSHQETKDMAPVGGARLAAVLKRIFSGDMLDD